VRTVDLAYRAKQLKHIDNSNKTWTILSLLPFNTWFTTK